jgi:GH15 family glucan-1,4-alpha-glucosidase
LRYFFGFLSFILINKLFLLKRNFYDLSETEIDLFNRSLLIVRAHFDNRGGVIASSDSDRLSYGKEGYTFVWPRDGALAAMAMDKEPMAHSPRAIKTFSCRFYFLL